MLKNQIASHMNQIVSHMTGRTCRARPVPVFALVSAAALILAACGGGGGGAPQLSLTTSQQPSYILGAIGASPTGGVGNYQGQGVVVAVIDGEFDTDHPDLSGAFRRNATGQVEGRNVYESHSDVRPIEERLRNPQPGIADTAASQFKQEEEKEREVDFSRDVSHATHMSGIIAARNNSFGTVGVAPRAEIVPIVLFRDFYVPKRYRGSASSDPDTYGESNKRVAEAVNYARSKNAFVINNSWGRNRAPFWVKLPNSENRFFLHNLFPDNKYSHTSIFSYAASEAWVSAANDERVIVFAAGNDGWNGETGRVEVYGKDVTHDNRATTEPLEEITTKDLSYLSNTGQRVAIPENIPSLESSYFLTNPALAGRWLAVVNVDKRNVISRYSNGCGSAMQYCLAAPGTNVQSTFARIEKLDRKDSKTSTATKRKYGDADIESGDGYGTYSGTSISAAVVSGAAAVVKSAAPNLTARNVVDILLRTATDLGAPGTDPVYGHGLVNLQRALQPIGRVNAVGRNARPVADIASTRISFSAAFGDAAASRKLGFGGLDSYGRVYRYRAAIQDRVIPGPRLSGVLAINKAVSPRWKAGAPGPKNTLTTSFQHSAVPESGIGDGSRVNFVGLSHRTSLTLARQKTSAALSPALYMAATAGQRMAGTSAHTSAHTGRSLDQSVWTSFVPHAKNVISLDTQWALSAHVSAGAYVGSAEARQATQRAKGYTIRDIGLQTGFANRGTRLAVRLGQLHESDRFLGSKPEGAYALARPTRSHYLHLTAHRRVADRITVGANLVRLRSRVYFQHNSFVRDTRLTAGAASAWLAFADAAREGDRLVLHLGQPLAVTGGAIHQTSVAGYNGDGSYHTSESRIGLGVASRHRMMQIVYRTPMARGVTGFAAMARHDNWSHQRGLGNNLVMLGLTMTP